MHSSPTVWDSLGGYMKQIFFHTKMLRRLNGLLQEDCATDWLAIKTLLQMIRLQRKWGGDVLVVKKTLVNYGMTINHAIQLPHHNSTVYKIGVPECCIYWYLYLLVSVSR